MVDFLFAVGTKIDAGTLLFSVQLDTLGAVGAPNIGRHLEVALRFAGLIELRWRVLIILRLRVGTQAEQIFDRFLVAIHRGMVQRGFAFVFARLNHGANVRMHFLLALTFLRFF